MFKRFQNLFISHSSDNSNSEKARLLLLQAKLQAYEEDFDKIKNQNSKIRKQLEENIEATNSLAVNYATQGWKQYQDNKRKFYELAFESVCTPPDSIIVSTECLPEYVYPSHPVDVVPFSPEYYQYVLSDWDRIYFDVSSAYERKIDSVRKIVTLLRKKLSLLYNFYYDQRTHFRSLFHFLFKNLDDESSANYLLAKSSIANNFILNNFSNEKIRNYQ